MLPFDTHLPGQGLGRSPFDAFRPDDPRRNGLFAGDLPADFKDDHTDFLANDRSPLVNLLRPAQRRRRRERRGNPESLSEGLPDLPRGHVRGRNPIDGHPGHRDLDVVGRHEHGSGLLREAAAIR